MCTIRNNTERFLTEPTERSCEGMKRSLNNVVCVGLEADEERGIFITSCDDENPEPVKFCPFCGTPMEVVL